MVIIYFKAFSYVGGLKMNGAFEEDDSLHSPIEAFIFDSKIMSFPIKAHWHYFAELIYVLEGCALIRADNTTQTVRQGEFILFHPSSVHSIDRADESFPRYAVLKFDINRLTLTPAYAPKLRDIFRYAAQTGRRIYFDDKTAKKLDCKRIFLTCSSEISNFRYGSDLVLQAEIYGLLMNIIRIWLADGMVINRSKIQSKDDYTIENITEYISVSLSDDLRVSGIAAHCNLSYSAFAKKFRDRYGISCKQYIERMRIFKVEEFLLFTDYDLNYISQETGFSDCSHLIKCFKTYKGTTPRQFRIDKRGKETAEL